MSKYKQGQVWSNPHFNLYIRCVNFDGSITVTEEKPFPGQAAAGPSLPVASMDDVVAKGGYKLSATSWEVEFKAQQAAIDAAHLAAGTGERVVFVAPPRSGLPTL